MIQVLVKLKVDDFNALEEFEQQAAKIMAKYHGHILSAFETSHESDGSGEEIHVLQFPNKEAFVKYREDRSLIELRNLRDRAISNTSIKVSQRLKSYV